jgi:hypothetical protein
MINNLLISVLPVAGATVPTSAIEVPAQLPASQLQPTSPNSEMIGGSIFMVVAFMLIKNSNRKD